MTTDLTKAIVRIIDSDGNTVGTGFILSNDGLVATCAHVIESAGAGPSDIVRLVFHHTGDEASATVEPEGWRDPEEEDIAILCLKETPLEEIGSLPLKPIYDIANHTFETFGFPEINPKGGLWGTGKILRETSIGGVRVLQLGSQEVTSGFSGAPIWDSVYQCVVGMVTAITGPDQYGRLALTAFATPLEELFKVWPALLRSQSTLSPTYDVTRVPSPHLSKEDWGQAFDIVPFFGRQNELAELHRWIVIDRCQLAVIWGIGGIGKTSLAIKLAMQIKDHFDYLFWRDIRSAPIIEDILGDCIKFLTDQQETNLPKRIENRISLLIEYLQKHRCLLVLDNIEPILQREDSKGNYRDGYEGYGKLFRQVGTISHRSCILLTTREKPKEIGALEVKISPVRSWQLTGIDHIEGRKLLEERELFGAEEAWVELVNRYTGNPLALKQVSATIRDLFSGEIATFLKQDTTIFGEIYDLLEQQFSCLSELEKDIMYWLAVEQEPASIQDLLVDTVSPVSRRILLEILSRLKQRSLIETSVGDFTLQPMVMEYVIDRLIEQSYTEIVSKATDLLLSHALVKAQAKDYVKNSQVRLILKPLADRLLITSNRKDIESNLISMLSTLREKSPLNPGYAGGNIANLLCQLECDLSGYDFSNTTMWQSYLKGVDLHDVSFAHSDLSKTVFTETFDNVISVVFSPDGQTLATSTSSGEIRLWRVSDGGQILACENKGNWVWSLAFSPDGRILASGGDDHTVRLWNVYTGKCLKTMLRQHKSRIRSIAFSPDGHLVASGSEDQTIGLWDVSTGQSLGILGGHIDHIRSVAFSPDGRILASGGNDQTVRVWDISTGQCLKTLSGHYGWVGSVAFSPDGKTLASGSEDTTVRVWNVDTGQCLKTLKGHTDRVRSVAFSSDGRMLASGGNDQTVRVWDVGNMQCIKTLQGHTDMIWSIDFSPDSRMLASGGEDQTIRLWDTDTGQTLQILKGYTNQVWSIVFNSNGRTLASGGDDQIVKLWDVSTGQCLKSLKGHTRQIRSVVFSPDDRMLASGSEDQTVRLWDTNTGQSLQILKESFGQVWAIAFNPDGRTLASATGYQSIRLWDLNSARCLKELKEHTNRVRAVAFSPDGCVLASGSEDQTVRLWDVSTGQCFKLLRGHTGWVRSVAFSPDGCVLASGSSDRAVRLWNVHTGQCLLVLQGHTEHVWSVAFSPDGCVLTSSSSDRTVRLWDSQTGQCTNILQGHTKRVWCAVFNPKGDILASCSDDGAIRIWDARTGEYLTTMRPNRPYERMNITGVVGLTEAQKTSLKALGAIEKV